MDTWKAIQMEDAVTCLQFGNQSPIVRWTSRGFRLMNSGVR